MLLVFTLCTAFSFRGNRPVYAFGVAASFNDSVVYYTDIQVLDSVKLDINGFLPHRDLYSYQLKNYIEYSVNKPNYTCMIYFSKNRSKLEKTVTKLKTKYGKSASSMQLIAPDQFSFTKPEDF